MVKIGFIPLRAGSKSIKNKNKKKLFGRPLFSWVLGEAVFSDLDEVYVFTDDIDIIDYIKKDYKWTNKIKVLQRGDENASDKASTENAMIEFSEMIDNKFDIICLLQATSPLTVCGDINNCLNKIINENYDSVLSVVNSKRFLWNKNGKSLNYNHFDRPRRQIFDGELIENGAVYAIKKEQFIKYKNRLGGRIGIVNMPEDTLIEIDEPSDWQIVEKLIENRLFQNKIKLSRINSVFLDVDGVFTDGKISYNENGEFSKLFSMRDGMGFEILRESEIRVFIITSEDSELVKKRMEKLKIKDAFYGIKDKYMLIKNIILKEKLSFNEIAYLGDDLNDLAIISSVGWGITPSDGVDEIKNHSDIILKNSGGNEAIREAISFILRFNKRFE